MSDEIKELENTPEKAVYQFGEGKNALTLSIESGTTTYNELTYDDKDDAWPRGIHNENTKYLKLELSYNRLSLYSIYEQGRTSASIRPMHHDYRVSKLCDYKKEISEKLFDDNSKEATAIKKFLSQIKGSALVDEINKLIKETPQRREEELLKQQKEQAKKVAEEQKRKVEAKQQELAEAQNRENAENLLNNFVGTDNAKILKKEEDVTTNDVATNKLATLREKIAHDIDETFCTNLEEKKIAKPLKKIEKAISDKLFGKVKE